MYFHLSQFGAWLNRSGQAFVLGLRLRRQFILFSESVWTSLYFKWWEIDRSALDARFFVAKSQKCSTLHMHRLLVQCKDQKIKAHCGSLYLVKGLPQWKNKKPCSVWWAMTIGRYHLESLGQGWHPHTHRPRSQPKASPVGSKADKAGLPLLWLARGGEARVQPAACHAITPVPESHAITSLPESARCKRKRGGPPPPRRTGDPHPIQCQIRCQSQL